VVPSDTRTIAAGEYRRLRTIQEPRALHCGSVATACSYLSNLGDRRLESIVNTPGREFGYTSRSDDLIIAIAEKRSVTAQLVAGG
jgi:hypothetical protein